MATAPIPRLTVDETWYDKAGNNVAAGEGALINGLLQPGEVQTVDHPTPVQQRKMNSNSCNFSHANGTVKPKPRRQKRRARDGKGRPPAPAASQEEVVPGILFEPARSGHALRAFGIGHEVVRRGEDLRGDRVAPAASFPGTARRGRPVFAVADDLDREAGRRPLPMKHADDHLPRESRRRGRGALAPVQRARALPTRPPCAPSPDARRPMAVERPCRSSAWAPAPGASSGTVAIERQHECHGWRGWLSGGVTVNCTSRLAVALLPRRERASTFST